MGKCASSFKAVLCNNLHTKIILMKWIFFVSLMGSKFGLSGLNAFPWCFIFKCKSSLRWFCIYGKVHYKSSVLKNPRRGGPILWCHFSGFGKNSSSYLKVTECWQDNLTDLLLIKYEFDPHLNGCLFLLISCFGRQTL